jgi:hypothetical protein
MSARPTTIQGVRAKLKRAAADAGLYLELTHSLKGWRAGVHVDAGYPHEAHRAGLLHVTSLADTGTPMDWVRSVLTWDELDTVSVLVAVSNSEPMVDYFSEDQHRVLSHWDAYVDEGAVSYRWAAELLGEDGPPGWTYDRGTYGFTESEVASLAPSDAHARALATCMQIAKRADGWNAETVHELASLSDTGISLFRSMWPDWAGTMDELLDAVGALVPDEVPAPAPVEPAPVLMEPVRGEPDALVEYLGRLLHVPKKEYARAVWLAVRDGAPVPAHSADWAGDVVRKVRRYANA